MSLQGQSNEQMATNAVCIKFCFCFFVLFFNPVFTHGSVMWNKLCQCTVNTISYIFVLFLQTILPLVNPATYRQCTRIIVLLTSNGLSAMTAIQPSMVIPAQPTAKATVSTLPPVTAIPTGQSTSVRNIPSTGSPSTPEVRK